MQRTDTSARFETLASGRALAGPIVVASDGAPASASAFAIARVLSERMGVDVNVVSALEPSNVLVPPIDLPPVPLRPGSTRVEERRARLAVLARGAAVDSLRWPVEIVLGDRVTSIARMAAVRRAQLVVTGRTHHGAVERMVRSETPLGIARRARVPVLTVPSTMTRLPHGIVVAVGLGDAGARAGAVAGALFGDAVAVHLVHVRAPALPRHERALREEEEADDRSVEQAFNRSRAAWRLPADVSIDSHVLVGKPAEELRAFARSVGADLIVVGLALATDTPQLPHRSLAPRLYREWPNATLLVPIRDAD